VRAAAGDETCDSDSSGKRRASGQLCAFQGGSAADKLGVDLEKEPRGAREEGGDALAARRLSGVQQHLVDEEGDRVDKLLRVFHSLGEQRVLFSCCRTPRRPKT